LLEQVHYRHLPLNEKIAALAYDRFLDVLDDQHSYLLLDDLSKFDSLKAQFAEMMHSGDVDPAYAIFNVFRERNRERLTYAMKLLDAAPDFTVDESISLDREHAPWAASGQELDELWRLRVKSETLSLMLTGKSWSESSSLLRKRYQHALSYLEKVKSEDVFELLMNAYCAAYDPHSNYFSPRSTEDYRIQMSLKYQGVGATLAVTDDYVTITNVVAGGPAQAEGNLRVNDRITAVGQGRDGALTDVIGWRLDDVVQLIRGKVDTIVRLQVLPAGAAPGSPERTLELTRNSITLDKQAAKKEVRTIERKGLTYKVGIITVPSFYADLGAVGDVNSRSTTHDVHKLIQELALQGVDGLILDLRGDGGGYLPEAIGLTHLFTNHGPVVQVRDADGKLEVLKDPDSGPDYSGPLSVLIDRTSASASEIFASAIQDYHRGVILGQASYGKGSFQSVVPLNRWLAKPTTEGQVTVSVGKFYRITGQSTQLKGVTPDIVLPSAVSPDEVGESTHEQAMPWDEIAAAPFQGLEPQAALIKVLADEQVERSEHDADYQWLLASLSSLESVRKEKSLSLNLKTRLKAHQIQDTTRLNAENVRRTADHLPTLQSVEDIVLADEPDVTLAQASQIMADEAAALGVKGHKPR